MAEATSGAAQSEGNMGSRLLAHLATFSFVNDTRGTAFVRATIRKCRLVATMQAERLISPAISRTPKSVVTSA